MNMRIFLYIIPALLGPTTLISTPGAHSVTTNHNQASNTARRNLYSNLNAQLEDAIRDETRNVSLLSKEISRRSSNLVKEHTPRKAQQPPHLRNIIGKEGASAQPCLLRVII